MDLAPPSAGISRLLPVLFSFRGRINRSSYLTLMVLVFCGDIVVFAIAALLMIALAHAVRSQAIGATLALAVSWFIAIAVSVVTYWATFALQAKRLHDLGRSGWWQLVGAVPYIGNLLVGLYTFFGPGNPGENRFGSPPAALRRNVTAAFVIVGAVFAGLLVTALRGYVVEPFSIPSGSNAPTVLSGDTVIASKFMPGAAERGDLVVFIDPRTGEAFIKRVVGLPGDTVQMRKGSVVVNDVAWPRERIADYQQRAWDAIYDRDIVETRYRYSETLPNGLNHEILGNPVAQPEDVLPQDDTKPFSVAAGHFFVIGDNRDNSRDSRLDLGAIPRDRLIGKVEFVVFSQSEGKALPGLLSAFQIRWDRIFRTVN